MNDQAGEQVNRQIADIIRREYPEVLVWPHTRVMAVINAALGAEERRANDSIEENVRQMNVIAELREQLAAERENRERLENALTFADKTNSGLHRVITGHDNQIEQLRNQLDAEREALERERMCHAACGVIALSNTRKSLAKNKMMKPEYLSASVQDCIKAAEREIELREKVTALQRQLTEDRVKWQVAEDALAAAVEALNAVRWHPALKDKPIALNFIDAALAKIGAKESQ